MRHECALRPGVPLALAAVLALGGTACEQEAASGPGGGDAGARPLDYDAGSCARPEQGCPCEPGAGPVTCYPEPTRTDDGTMMCRKGTRYCRDGRWTSCQSVHTYELETAHRALVTGPDECNPCNPDCATNVDEPNDSDLTTENSTDVAYDPSLGAITLESTDSSTADLADSDGDGVPDVADDYPSDSTRWHTEDDGGFYHTLPYGGSPELDPLNFMTQVKTADVYLLMDTTGSMGGEISNLQDGLTSGTYIPGCPGGIIGAIKCTIPDAWFGVGRFEDYPVGSYGGGSDRPYQHHLDLTDSESAAQSAVDALYTRSGYDWPESHTQALYAMATGDGLGDYLEPRGSCPGSRWGYPCFRPDTIPIVIMFTDAPFHNGPNPDYDYEGVGDSTYCCETDWWGNCISWCTSGSGWTPPTWTDSLNALNDESIKVISVESSEGYSDTRENCNALASGTGSVDGSGSPYVFSINSDGTGLSDAVVDAVQRLANYTRYDVTARPTDDPTTATVDERNFVKSITPQSWGPGDCAGISGSTFEQCTPGTELDFEVEFQNDFVMPTSDPQVFDFYIEVLLDGSVQQQIPVRITVPPETPDYPASGSYTRTYDANSYCDIPPQAVDWGTFSWEANTPDDTQIRFEFQTASTESDLSSAPVVSAAAPPRSDSGSLDLGELFVSEGEPNSEPYVKVTAVLLASSDRDSTPSLSRFELRYTCRSAE